MSVVIKGKPQNGDIINVENIQSANVDVFNTLDNLIKTLDSPIAGDEKALAKLANDHGHRQQEAVHQLRQRADGGGLGWRAHE
ncbi:hypothetical protein WJ970_26625 [Achromobacter xylosoxidans]